MCIRDRPRHARRVLAARVAGLPDPILYPGSYSDWVGAGLPVATGPRPNGPLTEAWSAEPVRPARAR